MADIDQSDVTNADNKSKESSEERNTDLDNVTKPENKSKESSEERNTDLDNFHNNQSSTESDPSLKLEEESNSPTPQLSNGDDKKNIERSEKKILQQNNKLIEMVAKEEKPKTQEIKKIKDKKTKKAVASNIEALTNSIKNMSLEQQVTTLLSKHAEVMEENRHLQKSIKTTERQVLTTQKEKDQIEADHAKAILTKSRLESVCRELQRQNKTIKDENTARLREEEERRKEASNKFNNTLTEISSLMQENTDKNTKLRDENQEMSKWLKDLIKQYESREEEVEKILKQRDIQVQLTEARLAKFKMDFTEDKEKWLIEKKAHLEELSQYQQKATQMSMVEIQLREQLNSYTEKYEEFQGTLEKSNQLFNTFKKEMDEMVKKIKKLEKETKSWKERWEGANKALLDMVTERSIMEKNLETANKQNTKLQNLCRAFQQQIQEMRANNTKLGDECTTPTLPPESPQPEKDESGDTLKEESKLPTEEVKDNIESNGTTPEEDVEVNASSTSEIPSSMEEVD